MESDFLDFILAENDLVTANRPLRLRLDYSEHVTRDMLLPQRVYGDETVCGGFEYRILCVSTRFDLPLKDLIALPAAIDFVTDKGTLRSVCGVITEASAGDSDGGLASYQLVLRDALALMEKRVNTRVFRHKNEVDIVKLIVGEWVIKNPRLGVVFKMELDSCFHFHSYPAREFTMQHNESDAAFIRRLLKRRGVAWCFRAEHGGEFPFHTLVLFNNPYGRPVSPAGTVRYHRDSPTEQRDAVTAWSAVRTLRPASVGSHSWDYKLPTSGALLSSWVESGADQGWYVKGMAASLDDYQVETPHAADGENDKRSLGQARMKRHDYEAKCFHGEGSVRDLCVGENFTLAGHPEIDTHPLDQRHFTVTALTVAALNNLPKALAARVERLFARNRWLRDGADGWLQREMGEQISTGPVRMHIHFTAVRRDTHIVPAYDPRVDLPQPKLQSAIVVGPPGEEVHCDELGRVKIRFPGTRAKDHAHASGTGASDSDIDSAWVRVASNWAGNGPGSRQQCGTIGLPRVGTEVLVDFLGGDPDRPVVVGQLYNAQGKPAALSSAAGLPDTRHLSGIKSREVEGGRANQLRFDDTRGQISAQLSSDHGNSELNLGFLTEPRGRERSGPRGEGVELRSDEQIAIRAAKGMLLTAWRQLNDAGKQMARAELQNLLSECLELAKSLGEYATRHQALPSDAKSLEELDAALKAWEGGSNTEPKGDGGGAPAIALTAPAGIGFATPKTVVSYAGTSMDTAARLNLRMTAGQRINLNAGKGVSLFSHSDGINVIAHKGKLTMQSQHDETRINAAKDLKLTATGGQIMGTAKEIVLIAADGSFIKIGDGITLGTNGSITHHGASFPFKGGGAMNAVLPTFEEGETRLRAAVKYEMNTSRESPATGHGIKIAHDDGKVVRTTADKEGKTEELRGDEMWSVSFGVSSPGGE